jgi:hypothetical protein
MPASQQTATGKTVAVATLEETKQVWKGLSGTLYAA